MSEPRASTANAANAAEARRRPVPTARWLCRFQADMAAAGFTEETIAALLPVVLEHLLRSEDLLTESED